MLHSLLEVLGGIGLFLIGLFMLTKGVKGVAGPSLRDMLRRFTATPLSGAVTGAAATALIQSSSATTVMAVGFVSAGVLTFPQALGVIFGANLGTTVTGWIVAILGFKLDLGEVVLPLVLAGALLRLLGRGRLASLGGGLAGFSLLFIGIEALKGGLETFEGMVTPTDFPGDTLFGRVQLVAIGVALTIVTQSSSAGVATALAALGAGAISFPQAAALVIGMDVGSTLTALMATVGGATTTRRTGYSHVVYNLLTGLIGFLLLPAASWAREALGAADPQMSLVAFHTAFNALGVILMLPFAHVFARIIVWLVPERGPVLTRALDRSLLADRFASSAAAQATVAEIATAMRATLLARLAVAPKARLPDDDALAAAIDETRVYVDDIAREPSHRDDSAQLDDLLHVLDHLGRLLYRCRQSPRIAALVRDDRLRRLRAISAAIISERSNSAGRSVPVDRLDRLRRLLRRQRKRYRYRIIREARSRHISTDELGLRLDAMRWLHRVAYHSWRIQVHLDRLEGSRAKRLRLNTADIKNDLGEADERRQSNRQQN